MDARSIIKTEPPTIMRLPDDGPEWRILGSISRGRSNLPRSALWEEGRRGKALIFLESCCTTFVSGKWLPPPSQIFKRGTRDDERRIEPFSEKLGFWFANP